MYLTKADFVISVNNFSEWWAYLSQQSVWKTNTEGGVSHGGVVLARPLNEWSCIQNKEIIFSLWKRCSQCYKASNCSKTHQGSSYSLQSNWWNTGQFTCQVIEFHHSYWHRKPYTPQKHESWGADVLCSKVKHPLVLIGRSKTIKHRLDLYLTKCHWVTKLTQLFHKETTKIPWCHLLYTKCLIVEYVLIFFKKSAFDISIFFFQNQVFKGIHC